MSYFMFSFHSVVIKQVSKNIRCMNTSNQWCGNFNSYSLSQITVKCIVNVS